LVTPRLKQLLLMLSSDQPGEVVAAACAIKRALKNEGRDWHDLVAGLMPPPPPAEPKFRKHTEEHTARDWRSMRDECLKRRGRLRGRELEFLTNLKCNVQREEGSDRADNKDQQSRSSRRSDA
jgi:hypothetical protein